MSLFSKARKNYYRDKGEGRSSERIAPAWGDKLVVFKSFKVHTYFKALVYRFFSKNIQILL